MIKYTRAIQNRKHYACATRCSPPADRFHTEKGSRFAFTVDTRAKFRTGMKF